MVNSSDKPFTPYGWGTGIVLTAPESFRHSSKASEKLEQSRENVSTTLGELSLSQLMEVKEFIDNLGAEEQNG